MSRTTGSKSYSKRELLLLAKLEAANLRIRYLKAELRALKLARR